MITKVLDKGYVNLTHHMGDALQVVNVARASYGKRKDKFEEKDEKLLMYLLKNNHTSPFRHPQVTFEVKVPEFVARQWYKHVVGANFEFGWNEVSQRYTNEFDFFVPDTYRKQSEDSKQASQIVKDDHKLGVLQNGFKAINKHCYDTYKYHLDRGTAKELARGFLPISVYTTFHWTTSFQAVMHFLSLRDHPHAQFEIREYCEPIRDQLEQVFPILMKVWNDWDLDKYVKGVFTSNDVIMCDWIRENVNDEAVNQMLEAFYSSKEAEKLELLN